MSRHPFRATAVAILVVALGAAGCGGASGSGPPRSTSASQAPKLSVDQRRRADRLVSVFENGDTTIQYGYAEDIGDGRGITAGRAGFTTATGDVVIVVERYIAQQPRTALRTYLPRLRVLAGSRSASTVGLEGFSAEWRAAAEDPLFRGVQDAVVDELYLAPATARATTVGLRTALGLAILYDTAIQHGDGPDPDGLPALIAQASARAGGTPAGGVAEPAWLGAFLDVRRADLANAADPETRAVWAESVTRVDVLRDILTAGNLELDGPIRVGHGFDAAIP